MNKIINESYAKDSLIIRVFLIFSTISFSINKEHFEFLLKKIEELNKVDLLNDNVYKMFLYSFLYNVISDQLFDYLFDNIFSQAKDYYLRRILCQITIDLIIIKYFSL